MPHPLTYRLPLPWLIAWRYMVHQRSRMLSSTARAALLATALGVTAMVIAMALMTGYTEDLERKLVGLQAEVTAVPTGLNVDPDRDPRLAAVAALQEVERVNRTTFGDGSLANPATGEDATVMLRGVDPERDPTVADPAQLATGDDGLPRILAGHQLLRRLDLAPGDAARLVVMEIDGRRPRFHYRSVRVGGSFTTGFAEFDASWVLLDRRQLEGLRGTGGLEVVELHLAPGADAEAAAARIEALLGGDYAVQSARALNRELFLALELQQLLLFLVLGLIVVVSTFNIASTLVVLVRERMRDVGVLGAMGLEPRQLWWVFTLYGAFLGALGTLGGVALGSAASWLFTTFELVRFGPEIAAIYFIDSVPFRVQPLDLLAIVVFTLAVTLVACALPAYRAASVRPSLALRYE